MGVSFEKGGRGVKYPVCGLFISGIRLAEVVVRDQGCENWSFAIGLVRLLQIRILGST